MTVWYNIKQDKLTVFWVPAKSGEILDLDNILSRIIKKYKKQGLYYICLGEL
jgi:hypothetical protein